MDVKIARRHAGHTLMENFLVLAMLAVLLATALPHLRQWLVSVSADSVERQYYDVLTLGRQTAIMDRHMVSFCGSLGGSGCDGDWNDGALLFLDRNGNAQLNEEDRVLRFIPGRTDTVTVYWRSFRNRKYLQLTPLGFTNNQSGSFTFCPVRAHASAARQLVINMAGRIRWARDENGDGLVEDASGKPPRCD